MWRSQVRNNLNPLNAEVVLAGDRELKGEDLTAAPDGGLIAGNQVDMEGKTTKVIRLL